MTLLIKAGVMNGFGKFFLFNPVLILCSTKTLLRESPGPYTHTCEGGAGQNSLL